MEERGIVLDREAGKAHVRIERSESCEGCHGCLYSDAGKYMIAEVIDKIGVSPGDVVRIESETAGPLKASALLFGFPLLMIFAGYAAGSGLAALLGRASQSFGMLGAGAFFVASFGLLYLFTHRNSDGQKDRSVIVEVLGRQESTHPI